MSRRNAQSPGAGKKVWLRGLAGLALIGMSMLPAFAQVPQSGDAKADAGGYALSREHSKILFSISHFVVSSTEGRFTAFDGKLNFEPQAPEHGSVTIHVSPGSISTDNAARDEHLRSADFFDAGKFPLATFESTGLNKTSGTAAKLTGMLTLHGVTRPITLNVTLRTPDLNADRLEFSAAGKLKRSDYGMTNYQGVIGDEVTLDIEAEFDRTH